MLVAALLLPATALGAKKERVAITIPDEHQLAVSRLSFKTKGTTKPKVKVSLANAGELHPDVYVASQVAREKVKSATPSSPPDATTTWLATIARFV